MDRLNASLLAGCSLLFCLLGSPAAVAGSRSNEVERFIERVDSGDVELPYGKRRSLSERDWAKRAELYRTKNYDALLRQVMSRSSGDPLDYFYLSEFARERRAFAGARVLLARAYIGTSAYGSNAINRCGGAPQAQCPYPDIVTACWDTLLSIDQTLDVEAGVDFVTLERAPDLQVTSLLEGENLIWKYADKEVLRFSRPRDGRHGRVRLPTRLNAFQSPAGLAQASGVHVSAAGAPKFQVSLDEIPTSSWTIDLTYLSGKILSQTAALQTKAYQLLQSDDRPLRDSLRELAKLTTDSNVLEAAAKEAKLEEYASSESPLGQLKAALDDNISVRVGKWMASKPTFYDVLSVDRQLAEMGAEHSFLDVRCTGGPCEQVQASLMRGSRVESDDTQPTPFVLAVVASQPSRSSSVTASKKVASQYVAGTVPIPNPEYLGLQTQYQTALTELQNAQYRLMEANSMPASIPAVVVQVIASRRVNQARNRVAQLTYSLGETPPTINDNMYAAYEFVEEETSALYEQKIGMALLRMDTRTADVATVTMRESTSFRIARDRRDDDPNPSTHAADSDLDAWLKKDRSVDFNAIAEGLTDARRDAFRFRSIDEGANLAKKHFVGVLGSSEAKVATASTNDSRFRHVVVVETEDGVGAGFFVGTRYILTNAHVVGTAETVMIRRYGRSDEEKALVLERDAKRDLALLKVTEGGMAAALWPSGQEIPVGRRISVIGHPRALEFSFSSGVVSGVRRNYEDQNISVLQTDAAINPGNSGGPLFLGNAVVGIVSFKFPRAEGLSFAIHVDEIRSFLESAFTR